MKLIIYWTLLTVGNKTYVPKLQANRCSYNRRRMRTEVDPGRRPWSAVKEIYRSRGRLPRSYAGGEAPARFAQIHSFAVREPGAAEPMPGWLDEDRSLFAPEVEAAFSRDVYGNPKKRANWD